MEDSKDQIEMLFSFTNAGGHGGFNGTKRSVRYLNEVSVRMERKQVKKHIPMDACLCHGRNKKYKARKKHVKIQMHDTYSNGKH